MILISLWFGLSTFAAEKQFDVLGYSPELNVIFAQSYEVPDNGKCMSFILDLRDHVKYSMGPVFGAANALVDAGEDAEGASCQTRDFAGQLEIKLKTTKSANDAERAILEPVRGLNWHQNLPGYKNQSVASLGSFLRLHRATWNPNLAQKLYELGQTEAEDKNWVDAYSALLIANDWKLNYTSKEGRERARLIDISNQKSIERKGVDKKTRAELVIAADVATRLDPKNAALWLTLAKLPEVGFTRRARLISRALALDPVMTTREFREGRGLNDLRCEAKAQAARKLLPAELVKDPHCT